MNGFLVPANAKRGTLIFNIFRPFDLIMFGTGMAVTLLLLVLVDSNNTIMILLSCLPVGVTGQYLIIIMSYVLYKVYLDFSQKEEIIYGEVGVFMKNSATTKNSSKYTEDWLPIKSIANGAIILDNKQKVTGIKIKPRNIFILDQGTQDNTIIALKNFYNTIDFEFWLISADRPVDLNNYLARLQLLYNQTPNPAVRKLINQDIDKANDFMNNNITDTEYYILFKDKNDDLIQKRLRTLITGLASAGLEAKQVSNDDLRIILDNFLNSGMTTNFGTVIA